MDHLAVYFGTDEGQPDLVCKLYSDHFDLPVDIPLLHIAEPPCFDGVSRAGVHPNQSIVRNSNQFFSLAALKSGDEV